MNKPKEFSSMATPDSCYNQMRTIRDTMADNIHDLVYQYGKKDKCGDYSISLYDRHFKDYCIVKDERGVVVRIKKCIILNPDDCQVRGHLLLQTEYGDNTSFIQLPNQEFNVYSHLYRIVKDMLKS